MNTQKFTLLDWIASLLLVVGGLNWGLVGFFDIDIVTALFGTLSMLTRIIFGLVGIATLYFAIAVLPKMNAEERYTLNQSTRTNL